MLEIFLYDLQGDIIMTKKENLQDLAPENEPTCYSSYENRSKHLRGKKVAK